MKYYIFLFLFIAFSCVRQSENAIKCEYKKYVLTGLNQPKHFYVDLVEVDTWEKYHHVYVSKHCNSWRELTLGDTLTLKRCHYRNGGNDIYEFDNLYNTLCE